MGRHNILIVSEDRAQMELVMESLLAAAYALQIVESGERLAEALERYRPALVLIDWSLPERGALAALRKLREDLVWRKSVIVIGRQMAQDDVIQTLEMGADLCLTEVFEPRVFVARVGALLRREGLKVAGGS